MAPEMKTVLIVEDDLATQDLLRQMVAGEGYHVLVAGDGKTAFEAVVQSQPDLVLMDIMMPEMHGFAVCQKIKADELLKRTKVIFLSSKSFVADRRQAEQVGADDYLAKPVTPDQLAEALRRHLGG